MAANHRALEETDRLPSSPKEALEQHSFQYRDFARLIRDATTAFYGIVSLLYKFGEAPKGAHLVFSEGDTRYEVTRKDLRSFVAQFAALLKEFKVFYKAAGRRRTKPAKPGDFRNIYTPVRLGEALITFLNYGGREAFGRVDPDDPNSPYLWDEIPLAREGDALRNSINNLMYIYVFENGLQNIDDPNDPYADASIIYPDHDRPENGGSGAFLAAFGSKIPALYYKTSEGTKLPNEQGLNTFQAIASINEERLRLKREADALADAEQKEVVKREKKYADSKFSPVAFKMFFLRMIMSHNVLVPPRQDAPKDLPQLSPEDVALLADPARRQEMLREHDVIVRAKEAWRAHNAPLRARRRDAKKTVTPRLGEVPSQTKTAIPARGKK